jgi:hypothetical protein
VIDGGWETILGRERMTRRHTLCVISAADHAKRVTTDHPGRADTRGVASTHEKEKHMAQVRTTRNVKPSETSSPRRTIASYADYRDAESAVDRLSDQGFAVERSAIIGTGLRSVEQVTGRMTVGRAALIGAGEGALIGAFIALLFGLFFSGPDFGELLLYSLAVGALFGGTTGAILQAASGEGRNFASAMTVATDHYEVQVDEDVAAEATRILNGTAAGNGAKA